MTQRIGAVAMWIAAFALLVPLAVWIARISARAQPLAVLLGVTPVLAGAMLIGGAWLWFSARASS